LGIRISIGAKRRDVLKLVLGQTLVLAAVGIAGGLVTAIAVTRFAASLLYGISPADPATFTLIAVLLLLVSLVAGYFPARRATRIDPTIALRSE
jgi:ABC-type antimicrobial peptide transport system permease subunit